LSTDRRSRRLPQVDLILSDRVAREIALGVDVVERLAFFGEACPDAGIDG
jgi:hypothetical protein